MQPQQIPTRAGPAPAEGVSPTAASPFISLSTQCDLLYYLGAQPHRYAFVTEQSVYTRAAEQLRFQTPSPLLPSVHHGDKSEVWCESVNEPHAEATQEDASPRVCIVTPPSLPFPPLRWIEQARAVEGEKESKVKGQQQSFAATSSSSTTRTPSPKQLVPSGADLAAHAFRSDFPTFASVKNRGDTDSAERPADAQVPTTSVESTAEEVQTGVEAPPQGAPAPPLVCFPSPLLMRAIAQMVLTMQASKRNSAAQFSLAQYRGARLPSWRRAVRQIPALSTPVDSLALQDALVFSVLPQVVADHCAATLASSTPPEAQADASVGTSAVFYFVAPHHISSPTGTSAIAGRKHGRAGSLVDSARPTTTFAEPPVVPGAVSCTRLSAASAASPRLLLSFSAVDLAVFNTLHRPSGDNAHATAASAAPLNDADTTLYDSETEWLTHGVLRRLFTFPGVQQPPSSAAPTDAAAATASADGSESLTEEGRSAAHAAFLKTNAFLFLAFLVHHSWCSYIHETVASVLFKWLARLKSSAEVAAADDFSFAGIQITCLPHLVEVHRSPQHEWKSELTYRLLQLKQAIGDGASGSPSKQAGKTWIWQLTVSVANRSAELHWHRWWRGSSNAHAASASAVAKTLLGGSAGTASGAVEGTGTLNELIEQF